MLVLVAGMMVAVGSNASKAQKPDVFPTYFFGQGTASCGDFLRAAENEHQARPANAPPGLLATAAYASYVSWVDGYMSGWNTAATDHTLKRTGQGVSADARTSWLENYCRSHPIDA